MKRKWPLPGDNGKFWEVKFWSPADWVSNPRTILVPPFAVLCILNGFAILGDNRFWSFWWFLWVVIGLLDAVDGKLARRYGGSLRGPTNDEQADKVCVFFAFLVIIALGLVTWWEWWLIALMIARDIFVTITRYRMKQRGNSSIKSARGLGKAKTVFQFLVIIVAMTPPHWIEHFSFSYIQSLSVTLLAITATVLSLVSGWQYFRVALTPSTQETKEEESK
ncbi:CDP-alcohol phosphatidyltransferase family protein [Candidatus Saccharibacteria bacterium]|nr:CDP-alcohol phosphatidyltransferase family protein [Candidatus Saccharibacteria bacterium]